MLKRIAGFSTKVDSLKTYRRHVYFIAVAVFLYNALYWFANQAAVLSGDVGLAMATNDCIGKGRKADTMIFLLQSKGSLI